MLVSGGDAQSVDEEEGGHTGDKHLQVRILLWFFRNKNIQSEFVEQVFREPGDHTKLMNVSLGYDKTSGTRPDRKSGTVST